MDYFNYRDGQLFAEDVALADIAKTHGSPCYVYSRATLERHWRAFDDALSGLRTWSASRLKPTPTWAC
jgi:diaminopimelate decarboxylase